MKNIKVASVSLQDCVNPKHRLKSLDSELSLYDLRNAKSPIVRVRFYGTQSASYCVVWVNFCQYPDKGYQFENGYGSGSGKATGYGYHRHSQAMQYALENCGIYLSESIGGIGDYGINAAIHAIADLLEIPVSDRLIHTCNA